MDTGDEEYFAAENLTCKPPDQLLYNVTGKSYKDERAEIPKLPGRSETGCVIPPEKSLPKPGTNRSPSNADPENTSNQKYLPKTGMTCSPTCLPSTTRPANAATHQSFLSLVQRACPRVRPATPFPLMRPPKHLCLKPKKLCLRLV